MGMSCPSCVLTDSACACILLHVLGWGTAGVGQASMARRGATGDLSCCCIIWLSRLVMAAEGLLRQPGNPRTGVPGCSHAALAGAGGETFLRKQGG
jgi:hypothetical protein